MNFDLLLSGAGVMLRVKARPQQTIWTALLVQSGTNNLFTFTRPSLTQLVRAVASRHRTYFLMTRLSVNLLLMHL